MINKERKSIVSFMLWFLLISSVVVVGFVDYRKPLPGAPVISEYFLQEELVRLATKNVIIADSSGKMTYVSPAVHKMLGYEHNELKDKNIELLIPERYLPRHNKKKSESLNRHDGKIATTKCYAIKKDKTERPVEIRVRVSQIEYESWMFVNLIPLEELVE